MKTKVFVAVPSIGTYSDTLAFQLRKIEKRYGDRVEFIYPEFLVHRLFHDFARNGLVDEFLASNADLIWFLDSDVTPPENVLDLLEHDWQVAAAPYPVFMTQGSSDQREIVFTVYKGTNGTGLAPSTIPYSGQEFVSGAATGCLFIKRDVFSKLEKPWFKFSYDGETRQLTCGEDIDFCLRLMKAEIPVFVDYSLTCKHIKSIDLLELNNYAIGFANKAVENYDAMIRTQVTTAVRAAYEEGKRAGLMEQASKSKLIRL